MGDWFLYKLVKRRDCWFSVSQQKGDIMVWIIINIASDFFFGLVVI